MSSTAPTPRPSVLYRGDQATRYNRKNGTSLMVDKYKAYGLHTNLMCGGNPLEVSRDGIAPTVTKHINGWDKSHYLSFSEDQATAEAFAGGMTRRQLVHPQGASWEAAIFSFDVSQMTWTRMIDHVYFGEKFVPTAPQYFPGGITRLALIDCVSLLRTQIQIGKSNAMHELSLAHHDKEWLIIPLDPLPPGAPFNHMGCSSALLPDLVSGTHYDFL